VGKHSVLKKCEALKLSVLNAAQHSADNQLRRIFSQLRYYGQERVE